MRNDDGVSFDKFLLERGVPLCVVVDENDFIRNTVAFVRSLRPLFADHEVPHAFVARTLQNLERAVAPDRGNDEVFRIFGGRQDGLCRFHRLPGFPGTLLSGVPKDNPILAHGRGKPLIPPPLPTRPTKWPLWGRQARPLLQWRRGAPRTGRGGGI